MNILAKLQARRSIVSCALFSWKMKNLLEIWI